MPGKKFVFWLLFSAVMAGCGANEGAQEQMVNLSNVQDNPEAQLANLNEAIANSKRDGSLYARRAAVLLRKGELQKALADANEAVKLTRNEPYSLFVKAHVLRALGNYQEALPIALQAERNSYQSSSLYILLGELYLQQKDYKNARAYLEKAQQLSPSDVFVFYYKGRVAEATQDTLRAIRNYKQALEQAPGFMEAQRELAGIYVATRDYAAAQPLLKQAESSDVKDGLIWYYKGLLYQGEQKPDSASLAFNKAISMNDTLQGAHYRLGLLKYQGGETEAAQAHLEKASRYRNQPRYLTTLAGVYERTGQPAKALQTYQRLIEIEPGNAYAYQAMSRLKYKLERTLPDTVNARQEEIEQID